MGRNVPEAPTVDDAEAAASAQRERESRAPRRPAAGFGGRARMARDLLKR
ncbi:MAG: hypothetical protein RID81_08175 [Sandaracinaceae bacterium]